MYIYLSKILPLFVMPVTLVMVLVGVAFLLLRRGRSRIASGLLVAAVVLLWAASTPLVADRLYGSLEALYSPMPLEDIPEANCVVLLGGSLAPPVAPRQDVELGEGVDRVYKAAQLVRGGKARYVIASAGNQPWSGSPWTEADLTRDLLVEWGVPEDAVFLEGSSRNTRENAVYSKILVDSVNCGDVLLVTSAAHMPRAVAAFRSAGIAVIPVSTDVRVVQGGGFAPFALLPDARALAMTSEALREWIGQWVYAMQGWG